MARLYCISTPLCNKLISPVSRKCECERACAATRRALVIGKCSHHDASDAVPACHGRNAANRRVCSHYAHYFTLRKVQVVGSLKLYTAAGRQQQLSRQLRNRNGEKVHPLTG